MVEELGRLVLEPDVLMPSVWVNFTEKLREEFPKVELIMYHSLFMTHNQRYWLKVFVDQRFRKDFGALQKKQKDAIRHFLTALGKKRENDDLLLLFDTDQVLKFVSLRSRQGSRGRRGQRNSDLSKPEAVFGEQARDIIAINRDGVVHGCKCDPSKKEIAAMPDIKNHWRTPEKVLQLLLSSLIFLSRRFLISAMTRTSTFGRSFACGRCSARQKTLGDLLWRQSRRRWKA